MRLLGLQFPGLSFFPFLKIGITFAFLQLALLPVSDQRLPGLASQWYLPALSSLVGASCQDPWTHVQFTFVLTDLILFLASFLFQPSSHSLEMAFLKADHDNKVWGKENIPFNQVPCLIRQWSHNFLSLSLSPMYL